MHDTRFKKIWSDLTARKGRTLLTLIGLLIGVWGIGSVAVAYLVLSNDLGENYAQTNAPSVVVNVANEPEYTTPDFSTLPTAIEVENRPLLYSRIETRANDWLPLLLFVVEDFNDQRIARMFPEQGAWPPPPGTMVIERDGELLLKFIRKQETGEIRGHSKGQAEPPPPTRTAEPVLGSEVRVRLSNGQDITAQITGTVFDPGQAPSKMERIIYGYVTRETADAWMKDGYGDRLIATVGDWNDNPASVTPAAKQIMAMAEDAGGTVRTVGYPSPDTHPHQFQMNSILFLLTGLGVLALVMSLVLVVNLVSGILTNQIRQIGVLKAIGASTRQVSILYFSSMLILGVASSLIALPFITKAGYLVVRVVSAMLNFEILTTQIPVLDYALMVLVGSLFPVAAAWFPVRKWSGLAVRNALDNYGLDNGATGGSIVDKMPLPLPLTLRLGIRNSLRKPRRFILTVATLSGGVLIFILAMNVRSSLLATADKEEATKLYDVTALFTEPVELNRISWITKFPIVERIELWPIGAISTPTEDGTPGQIFSIRGVPEETKALIPNIMAGEWLDPADPDGIVINHRFSNAFPYLEVGKTYDFLVGGERRELGIRGIYKEFGGASVYMLEKTLQGFTGSKPGGGRFLMATLKDPANDEHRATLKVLLEEHFEILKLNVIRVETTKIASLIIRNHLDVIVMMLLFVAFLMLVVSGLGIASGIATAVVERTRELGTLRAVGATPKAVIRIILAEGVFMAVVAWGLALAIAPYLTSVFGTYFGSAFVEYPFDYATSDAGVWISLAAAFVLTVIASYGPAKVATSGAVSKAIAYE